MTQHRTQGADRSRTSCGAALSSRGTGCLRPDRFAGRLALKVQLARQNRNNRTSGLLLTWFVLYGPADQGDSTRPTKKFSPVTVGENFLGRTEKNRAYGLGHKTGSSELSALGQKKI